MSTYVIGDIQGCYKALRKLLKKLNFSANRDQLWCVGDLVNRGPDSLDTLRFLQDIDDSVRIVLGNHDLHFLDYHLKDLRMKVKQVFIYFSILNIQQCTE